MGVSPFDFYLLSPRELAHMFLAHSEMVQLTNRMQYEALRFQAVHLINHFLPSGKQYTSYDAFHMFAWETPHVQSVEEMLENMKGIAAKQNTQVKKKGK